MYILLAILLLAILITVHEFGHFLAARAMKIEVREFAIGMGPKLFGWKSRKYETAFAVRAIPVGGYCAFYGEDDPTGKSRDDPRAFPKQNVWKRLFVILMGPMMNFVLAFVVATVFYWVNGISVVTGVDPYIAEIMAAGPANFAGMEAGDRVTEINGKNMLDGTVDTLLDTIQAWKEGDGPLQMTVERGDKTLHMEMTPVWDETEQHRRDDRRDIPDRNAAGLFPGRIQAFLGAVRECLRRDSRRAEGPGYDREGTGPDIRAGGDCEHCVQRGKGGRIQRLHAAAGHDLD